MEGDRRGLKEDRQRRFRVSAVQVEVRLSRPAVLAEPQVDRLGRRDLGVEFAEIDRKLSAPLSVVIVPTDAEVLRRRADMLEMPHANEVACIVEVRQVEHVVPPEVNVGRLGRIDRVVVTAVGDFFLSNAECRPISFRLLVIADAEEQLRIFLVQFQRRTRRRLRRQRLRDRLRQRLRLRRRRRRPATEPERGCDGAHELSLLLLLLLLPLSDYYRHHHH